MPVVVQRHMHSLGCQGRRLLRRGADAVSYGPDCSEKDRDSPVAVHSKGGRRHCWAGPADSTCAVSVKTALSPQLHVSYSFPDKVVDMPVVFNDKYCI